MTDLLTLSQRVEEATEKLTEAQREMLTRSAGRYQDDPADVICLLDMELLGTCTTELGSAVAAALRARSSQEK